MQCPWPHTDYRSFLSFRFLAYKQGLVIVGAVRCSDTKVTKMSLTSLHSRLSEKVGEGLKRWPRG